MTESIEETIRSEFLLEAAELLEGCESSFLSLESQPGNKDILDQIFRLAHTIKGSGLAVGFDHLAGFAHLFENLLDQLRNDRLEQNDEVLDLLLRSNDMLMHYVTALSRDKTSKLDCSALEQEINRMIGGGDSPKKDQSQTARPKESIKPLSKSPMPVVKVLAVDDDSPQLELIELALEDLGVEVLRAGGGKEAMEIYQRILPDLVISDLKMPDINGIELARRIASHGQATPIIFVSGYAGLSDLAEFINLGAVGFVEKPYDPGHLNLLVKQALHAKFSKEHVLELARLV